MYRCDGVFDSGFRARNEKLYNELMELREAIETKQHEMVDDEIMTDEEWRDAFSVLAEKGRIVFDAILDSQLITKRSLNDWQKGFIASFDDCECKRISGKQAAVFARIGEEWETHSAQGLAFGYVNGGSVKYAFQHNGKAYFCHHFGNMGYLTIRDIITVDFGMEDI